MPKFQVGLRHCTICIDHLPVRKGYEEQLSNLAEITEDVCKSRVKGDAWLLWSMAQRASLLIKIDACITKGNTYHIQAAVSSIFGQSRLRDCLEKVHKDIITCWNFKDEGELNSREFQDRMIQLAGEVQKTEPSVPNPPNTNEANTYATLAASTSFSYVPVVAAVSAAALTARWLTGQNLSNCRQLLIAYIVDLVKVLIELFNITLRVDLALKTSWAEIHQAIEAYRTSSSFQSIHESIRSKNRSIVGNWNVNKEVRQLLDVGE